MVHRFFFRLERGWQTRTSLRLNCVGVAAVRKGTGVRDRAGHGWRNKRCVSVSLSRSAFNWKWAGSEAAAFTIRRDDTLSPEARASVATGEV